MYEVKGGHMRYHWFKIRPKSNGWPLYGKVWGGGRREGQEGSSVAMTHMKQEEKLKFHLPQGRESDKGPKTLEELSI